MYPELETGAPAVPGPRRDLVRGPGVDPARARSRYRRPPTPHLDAVVFTARCPACGADSQWSQQRDDTRLTTLVDCRCHAA